MTDPTTSMGRLIHAATAQAGERADREQRPMLVWISRQPPATVWVRTAEEGEPEGAVLLLTMEPLREAAP